MKGICFKQLPNSLCIHLKRFEFDYEQMTRWKIKDRCVCVHAQPVAARVLNHHCHLLIATLALR